MPTVDDSIATAEQLLRSAWSSDVRLERRAQVLAEHAWPTVMRTEVTAGADDSSVVVKTYRSWAPYEPDDPNGPAGGILNEWAGLALLNETLPGAPSLASLYAASREAGVLVLSDLGRGRDLEAILTAGSCDEADHSLIQLARLLARIHAATFHRHDRYRAVRTSLGPLGGRNAWIESMWSEALAALADLGAPPAGDVLQQLEMVKKTVTEPGAWAGLCHAEPGNGNVVVVDGHVRLVDFEASEWGHVLVDAAFPRMAFGHLPATGRFPDVAIEEFETAYASELAKRNEAVAASFASELALACMWLALVNLAASYKLSFGESAAPFGGERGRRQLGTQWRQMARSQNAAVADFAARILDRLGRAWGVAVFPELPIYPAFENAARG